jgi:serine/threonine protein kinase
MGLARLKHGTFLSEVAPVGTFAWTAPEVLLGQQCNQSADIYGFGVVSVMWIEGAAALSHAY